MAQGLHEVEDVTSICSSLVLNMGTLEDKSVPAMMAAGKTAAKLGHPIILDPVGVTASRCRRQAAMDIIRQLPLSVIRGNEAEIRALEQELGGHEAGNTCGVDSCCGTPAGSFPASAEALLNRMETAVSLARMTGAVTAMTGREDVVAGNAHRYIVRNGHPWMARITGSGCMLDGLMGAFCALETEEGPRAGMKEGIEAAVAAALCAHGLCGEIAARRAMEAGGGTGTFRIYLLDAMSLLDDETLERGKKIEIR